MSESKSIDTLRQSFTLDYYDQESNEAFIQITKLYNNVQLSEILFLLPKIFTFDEIAPVMHLIIGCTLIKLGRSTAGLREVGYAICKAQDDKTRKEFLKTLAFAFIQYLNDPVMAKNCLGEYMDISRGNITTEADFQNMQNEVIELDKNLKNSKPEVVVIKSFEEQVLELSKMKQEELFDDDSFTGKSLIVIRYLHQCESELSRWANDKRSKNSPLRILIEAIFTFGPLISYNSIFKFEPVLNKYMSNLSQFQKKRSFSMFPIKEETLDPTFSHIHVIRGFVSMLRHQYKEAVSYFDQANFSEEVDLLKCYCQANDVEFKKLKSSLAVVSSSSFGSNDSFKLFTIAKLHERLMMQHKFKKHRSDEFFASMKFFITGILCLPVDDLYYCEYYDKMLDLLIRRKSEIEVITFFYILRNYYGLKSEYNYLYIPNLVYDYNCDDKIMERIQEVLKNLQDKRKIECKETFLIEYWYEHHIEIKGKVPNPIEVVYKQIVHD
ncbi:unnamed protein product [Candida verbasci]|uniref:Uncharacterized protein n=1 Tax=Candida verbasci TaxID=1227364 RepID=A0A9W4TWQ6_9ASCO|nr:unnamed protein product [Candida verbasci]